MEPAESLPPRPMQRKRGRAAVHVKMEASKVEKRVNTANNKTKRRPAQLKAFKCKLSLVVFNVFSCPNVLLG